MMPDGVTLTSLRRVHLELGDVLHGMRSGDVGFAGFGEAYFTFVNAGAIKGWRRHRKMTLNLICPLGGVRVVVHDGGADITRYVNVVLSPDSSDSYQRLTVAPMYWVAFQGLGEVSSSLLLNIASIPHDPNESETVDIRTYPWPK